MITRQKLILSVLSFVMFFLSIGCPAISQVQRADEANMSQKKSGIAGQEGTEQTLGRARELDAGAINPAYESEEQGCVRYDAPDGAVGVARCYAKRYSGRKTSAGEIHSPKNLTAAHSCLPLGTRVKVINLANNKSVIVKVNDRCREREEPFIDLSQEAARKLGIIRRGKADVRIIIVGDEDTRSEHASAEKNNESLF